MMQLSDDACGSEVGLICGDTYRLLRRIGAGGMSDVYAAEHLRIGKIFAIKILRSTPDVGPRAIERFSREARALAGLNDDHLVTIVDSGRVGSRPYLVMELLHGEDLRSLLARREVLAVRHAINLALGVSRGLIAMHLHGLVHRDLKPANIFIVRKNSGEEQYKILDLGIAKMEHCDITGNDGVLGTLRYMAPEQFMDPANVSPASDVYSLGAVLFECLVGHPFRDPERLDEVMRGALKHKERVSQRAPRLAPEWAELIELLTEPRAERRPSASEVAALLKAVADRLDPRNVAAETCLTNPGFPVNTGKWRAAWPTILGFVMVSAGIGVWVRQGKTPAPPALSCEVPRLSNALAASSATTVQFTEEPARPIATTETRTLGAAGPIPSQQSRARSRTKTDQVREVADRTQQGAPTPGLGTFDARNPYAE